METPKILGQSSPSAGVLTDIYTVPPNTRAVLSNINVCNRSVATSFRISVAIAGAADAVAQYLVYDAPIAANEPIPVLAGITLAPGDVVRVYAAAATLSFSVFGVEIT